MNFRVASLTIVLSFCMINVLLPVYAQKVTNAANGEWHIQEMNHARGNFYSPASYSKSIILLAEGGYVATVRFRGEDWGVVKLNQEGKLVWQSKIKGAATGIARIKDNFIVTYSDEHDNKKGGMYSPIEESLSKKISAVVLDGKNGKLLSEKIVYNNNNDAVYIDSRILARPDGQFAHMLIRVTNLKKGTFDEAKELKARLSSEKIMLVDLGSDLDMKITDIQTPGKEGWFVGSGVTTNDDFYFATIQDEELVVERFKKDGSKAGRLATPISVRAAWPTLEPITTVDPFDPDIFFVGLRYTRKNKDRMNQVYAFNFSNKKILGSGEQELNKEYGKSLEYTKIKGLQDGDWRSEESFRIVDIVATQQRIGVIKEMQYTTSNGPDGALRFRKDAVVVEIYDRAWKLLKTIALDKKYEAFTMVGGTVGCRVRDNKLDIVMSAVDGPLLYATVCARINLDTPALEEYKTLARNDIRNIQPAEGGASLWFPGGVFLEYLVEKGGILKSRKDYSSIWHKVELQ